MTRKIWAASALLDDGWASSVEITIDADGNIASVTPDCPYGDGDRVEQVVAIRPNGLAAGHVSQHPVLLEPGAMADFP